MTSQLHNVDVATSKAQGCIDDVKVRTEQAR